MMKSLWTDERNRLSPESVKNLLMVQYNFKNVCCENFYKYCLEDKNLLKEIRSKSKYDFK